MPADAPRALPPSIGRYRIRARLASDAIGDLYQGFDPLIERMVAVEVFHVSAADPAADAAVKETFYREVQRTGALSHHGIATLFDAGEAPGGLFIAREFVDGSSLADLLARPFEMDVSMRVSLLLQIVDALEYARELGVPHLALKPSHVLVSPDFTIKVANFGVAPLLDALALAGASPTRISASSAYIAPERSRGEPADHRADVFSLGRIVLDLFGATDAVTLPAILDDHRVPIDQWQSLMARALAPDPVRRFATADALKLELLMTLGMAEIEARLAWETAKTVGTLPALDAGEVTLAPSHASGLFDDATTVIVDRRARPGAAHAHASEPVGAPAEAADVETVLGPMVRKLVRSGKPA